MKQSRAASLAESIANVAVGFGVACAANLVFLPLFGMAPSTADILGLGAAMTAVSVARSYCLRRGFEALRARRARAEARVSMEWFGVDPAAPRGGAAARALWTPEGWRLPDEEAYGDVPLVPEARLPRSSGKGADA